MKLSIAIVAVIAAPAAAEAPLSGNVLVWADATLYLDANPNGPSVRIGTLDLGREKDVGHVVPMRVVGVQGELVEVEPTAEVECAWWRVVKPDGLDNVRLYVKRTDLAPVLIKPFKATYNDGTTISLEVGVPVLDNKVAFNRGVIPVTIPSGALGLAYPPHKIAAVVKADKKKFLLDQGTDVKLGSATFPLGPWVSPAATPRGDRMLVSIAARCMTAVISAPKARVHAGISINQAIAGDPAPAARLAGPGGHYLPAGTKMTSEKGDHVIGTLDADRDVVKPKAGARACAAFVITRDDPFVDVPHTVDASQPQRTLTLCASATALKAR